MTVADLIAKLQEIDPTLPLVRVTPFMFRPTVQTPRVVKTKDMKKAGTVWYGEGRCPKEVVIL